ncbi:class I SAM-dependent methyltransferase [Streptomyces acidiscabies]|uniref:Class I SAM-dependent methyltransferase n=1 Tax=Streptomyces acidiscabies TaxID=42234 RepID=A0AAP6BG57_9ACTN|nr:class I SAM-dependent methyltransferase [Streptomyces acidiscabies]MBP5937777.1 class I SAM-dependent methyltransferase [Streptomyces sp. LBUM 1476]MBZ3914112.1 class I SAM-dependent methyltransferase [Streptomyces acidiscabies]MDX2964155.1 class I SAM-dependent methyltransferase [Streptomyces acidiscabies]MDX3025761.1 class I SAM-dependent methyltransferase [Streptomyces acidiscabies]MDX3794177.1 class I SAM-dependent methyltransferase [Streptomyces acidiscabies]
MTASPHSPTRARSFDSAAAQYAANRPSYPAELLDTIEELAGRRFVGSIVGDVGAGTGISTRVLYERGANVVGVEPGDGMAAEFRRTLPDVPLVRGDGNNLPFRDGSIDFLTYAQSWHWTDPNRAVPEALRVLRPGGALALWWNTTPYDVAWLAAQARRLGRHFGIDVEDEKARATRTDLADPTGTLTFTRRTIRWSRSIPLDTHLANIGSHSAFLVDTQERTTTFLTTERAHLLTEFPDATVEETYDVTLLLAQRTTT